MKMGHPLSTGVPAALLLAVAVLALASTFLAAPAAALAAGQAGWETQALPTALQWDCSSLAGIWGRSPSDVLAAASCGAVIGYDGQAWALRDPGPLAPGGLEDNPSRICAIWGSSAPEIFLGGSGYSDQEGPHAAVYRLRDGEWTSWAVVPGDTACINGLWGASASDNIYAVGGDEDGGRVSRWNGSAWTDLISYETAADLRDVQLNGAWGSSASDVYAVGGGMQGNGFAAVLHFDGSQWSTAETGPSSRLNAVWGSSASDVFAVGQAGTILHYDGAAWASHESGTAADLTAVWGTSAADVFAAGQDADAGTMAILHYDGLTWARTSDATMEGRLLGLWGSSASDVFAVGDAGAILHYAGPAPAGPDPAPADPAPTDPTPTPGTPPGDAAEPTPAPAQPLIAALQAESGRPGEDLTVSITGTDLGGAATVDFGCGITVREVTVISETEIAAAISIDGDATAGQRTITVTTTTGTAVMPGGFLVREAGTAERLWVYPLAALAGAAAALGLLALLRLGLRRRAR